MSNQILKLESIVLDEDNDYTCSVHSFTQALTELKIEGKHYVYLCQECADRLYDMNKQDIEGQKGPKQ